MLFRGLLFAGISFSVLGQAPAGDHEALKHALGLSDSQLSQLQQGRVEERRRLAIDRGTTDTSLPTPAGRILDDSQIARLAVIEKALNHQAAAEAIVLGLISAQQWPGGPESLCYYSISNYAYKKVDALGLGLTDSQVRQFEQLEQAARGHLDAQIIEKEKRRSELLRSGIRADSPTVVQLVSDISKLWDQTARTGTQHPQRDLARAVLDDAQKAKFAAFGTALQLASEALDLALIHHAFGVPLCH